VANEAANYGFDEMMDHDKRSVRAHEFLKVAYKLWDSIEPDALILDRERGVYADPEKVHRIDHRGRYFKVRGTYCMAFLLLLLAMTKGIKYPYPCIVSRSNLRRPGTHVANSTGGVGTVSCSVESITFCARVR
jgi:hypothetical protein